ncbi:MAG: nucleoside hydrolase, partial [Hyphomicrobiales bacterium]|nr:nucleoside hydrolase [Hyphomicrobiales bacterium]
MATRTFFLDVDTGIDDAFAILRVAAEPGAEIAGISAVAGNVDVATAARNTRAVLALAGAGGVPVHVGATAPLSGAPADAREVHGGGGLGRAVLPEPPGAA